MARATPKPQLVQIQLSPALVAQDAKLLRTVDSAFAAVARKSGDWLVCKAGCTQCCHGPFPISQLDAARLRHGLAELALSDPKKAKAIRARANAQIARLTVSAAGKPAFPGNAKTGVLSTDEAAIDRFEDYAEDEPCPALSVSGSKEGRGRCELYASRPLTCRVFGPPMQSLHMGGSSAWEGSTRNNLSDARSASHPERARSTGESKEPDRAAGASDFVALGHCELCYHGATPEEVAACELDVGRPADALEAKLNKEVEKQSGARGQTFIAFALR